MRVLNDFECTTCGEVVEKLIDHTIQHVDCECGGTMVKLIAIPNFKLEGLSGDFPTAYDQWEKKRRQKMAQELKAEEA